ncbi:MAG: AtpZ/AtpI family protein [Patescibacteria group bacterium]
MSEKGSTFSALKLSLELGYTIAIPIVVLALVGRLLDKKFDTSPWLLITGIILSMVVSSVALVLKFNAIMKNIQEEDKKEKEHKQTQDTSQPKKN